jgi:CPA2 family monovalent cation:H+ antiporter-2
MQDPMPLVTMLVAGIGLAYLFAMVTQYFRLSPIVGYLLAGVFIGPATPGFTADLNLAHQLSEIGIILIMFGVGLHFSWEELLKVKIIAISGALCQIFITTLMGLALAQFLGWSIAEGLIYSFALSVASTVVLLRALQDYDWLKTSRGQIAVGWLIIEDLFVVMALVFLPAIATVLQEDTTRSFAILDRHILITLAYTLFKIMAFFLLILIVGKRIIPWILMITEKTKSNELFRLCVLAIALCVAYGSTKFFGVSLSIGSFFAGMLLSESKFSRKAAKETLPLRDAFAVLFFVSMGMLLNPNILMTKPLLLLITVLIIIFGKSLAAYLIMIVFRYPQFTALTISVSLAQIGEFSFILADMGVKLKMLSEETQDIIIAAAIISILINQLLFKGLSWVSRKSIY